MSQYLDGVSSTASQHGPKQISLPLQADGNYHATLIRRNYIAAPASAYEPIIGQRTAYTSLLRYSDDFSQANWVKVNTTGAVTAAVYDPEGGVTASKVAEDATGGAIAHNVSQVLACAAGATPFGVFAKAAERTFIRLRLYNATDGSLGNAVFNLSTGVLASGTGTIKKLLNGWYWCYITQTAAVTNSTLFVDLGSDATTFSYAGTAGSGVYLWRATAYLASAMGPAIATTATTPTAVTAPPIDTDDPTAFLVSEQEPSSGPLEIGVPIWSRQYANIPKATINYSTLALTKPSAPNQSTGTLTFSKQGTASDALVAIGTGNYYNGFLFPANNEVYGLLLASVYTAAAANSTGGTFTISYKSVTTAALNDNDSTATIAAAINGLSTVIADGITVTVDFNFRTGQAMTLTLTVGSTSSRFTCDATSLTGWILPKAFTVISSSTSQIIYPAVKYAIAGHTFNAANCLALVPANVATASVAVTILQPVISWSVIDVDTIAVCFAYKVISNPLLSDYLRAYTPGTARIRTRLTDNFYLPGFSPGIASATDIPIPSVAINDTQLLALVTSGATGYQTYDAEPLALWDGPIYRQRTIDIDADNL